jgi:hypothetical protein
MKIRLPFSIMHGCTWIALLTGTLLASAQTPSRFVGSVTAIAGNTLTVQADRGEVRQIAVPATVVLRRIVPGQRDLENAEAIPFNDLAVGDRVLVKLDAAAPGGAWQALRVVAIKRADLELKRQRDREEWQRHGVGGLVKSVDTANGVILLTSGAGAAARTITVHTTGKTLLKRYAPASVRFDAALPAPIETIHIGDQLRARGVKNVGGTEIAAAEVVSGSFRNIAGTVISFDTAAATLTVKDLATKKPVTLRIAPDTQMRRLADRMAQRLAAQLKGGSHAEEENVPPPPPGPALRENGEGDDPQQILGRAPTIQLGDLKKGEAVMLVATEEPGGIATITLLAGAAPLLESTAASQNLLSNWSIGTGSPDVAQ